MDPGPDEGFLHDVIHVRATGMDVGDPSRQVQVPPDQALEGIPSRVVSC
ncbi:MAG TPA: hypothetical protein VFH70_05950 [Acidimicrobiales bacterium]|nr:hypothetical protein [Acidimicrobiales bacterium]